MHRIYDYLVFPLAAVQAILAPPDSNKPDAYVSKDSDTTGIREAAQKGYRWIRTHGENAVFENVKV
jgi:hypothetical protein